MNCFSDLRMSLLGFEMEDGLGCRSSTTFCTVKLNIKRGRIHWQPIMKSFAWLLLLLLLRFLILSAKELVTDIANVCTAMKDIEKGLLGSGS